MNDKILVLAGSNSSSSINQAIAQEIGKLNNIDYLDTRKLKIPYYNYDIEEADGILNEVIDLYNTIREYKKLIIVSPEYNGYTPAFLKSILDWLSRYNRFYLEGIDLVIVSVTPGQKKGASVRAMLKTMLSFTNANILGDYGIGNYDINNDYSTEINEILAYFK